jgi:hypothetical protein
MEEEKKPLVHAAASAALPLVLGGNHKGDATLSGFAFSMINAFLQATATTSLKAGGHHEISPAISVSPGQLGN